MIGRLAAIAILVSAVAGTFAQRAAAPPSTPAFARRVTITPVVVRVFAGTALRFRLASTPSTGGTDRWSVIGPGTIDADGLFRAPLVPGASARVIAAEGGAAAAAAVTIVAPPPDGAAIVAISCYDDGGVDVRSQSDLASAGQLSTGARTAGLAIDARRHIVYVAAEARLEAIDLRTASVSSSEPVAGARFSEVAMLAGGYVAATDNEAVAGAPGVRIFSLGASGAPMLASSVAAGDTPEGIAVAPDGRTFYVTDVNDATMLRFSFDARTGRAHRTGAASTGDRPFGVAVDTVHRLVFVADNDTPTVSGAASKPGLEVFSLPSLHRVARVSTGTSDALPLGVAADPSLNRVFVTNEGDADVAAYSIVPFRLVGTAPTGRTPWLPAIDVRRGRLYVPSALDDSFTAFDAHTLRPIATGRPTCGYPTAMAISG